MRVVALLLPLFFITGVTAQDDVLAVERRADLRGHAAAVKLLKKTRMPVVAVDMTAKELCTMLTVATASKLGFMCSRRVSEAAPKLNLDLRSTSLWSVMAIAHSETGLRFVLRHGVVFLTEADKVKPLTYLQIYDLRGACAPLRSFPGPDLRLRTSGDDRPLFPEEVESTSTISGFTADVFENLLRESVRPDSWSNEGVTLSNQNGLFLIRQTPQVHREIEVLLIRAGLRSPQRLLRRTRPVRNYRIRRISR